MPASCSFKSSWASWGCNVPLVTQALGNYATGFLLASQSRSRACGFTHGHLKASAHSFLLEVDFFFSPSVVLQLVLLWCDVRLCSPLITLAGDYWPHTYTCADIHGWIIRKKQMCVNVYNLVATLCCKPNEHHNYKSGFQKLFYYGSKLLIIVTTLQLHVASLL